MVSALGLVSGVFSRSGRAEAVSSAFGAGAGLSGAKTGASPVGSGSVSGSAGSAGRGSAVSDWSSPEGSGAAGLEKSSAVTEGSDTSFGIGSGDGGFGMASSGVWGTASATGSDASCFGGRLISRILAAASRRSAPRAKVKSGMLFFLAMAVPYGRESSGGPFRACGQWGTVSPETFLMSNIWEGEPVVRPQVVPDFGTEITLDVTLCSQCKTERARDGPERPPCAQAFGSSRASISCVSSR